MIARRLRNPGPGEILKEEFLNEIGMSQNRLAHAFGAPQPCVSVGRKNRVSLNTSAAR
jgi:plasmid maintenance system antidote protein VapI